MWYLETTSKVCANQMAPSMILKANTSGETGIEYEGFK